MSKVHARSHAITNKPLWVRTTKILAMTIPTWKTNYNCTEKCASDVKKMKNRRKQNFEGEANNIQSDKENGEATRIAYVFLISWFFYLFPLRSISLLVKCDFILRYEAWVNTIRASSFIENFPQISAKPIAFQRNLLGKLPRNRPFFTNRFSAKLASENSREIPAKSAVFSANLSLKILRNLTSFPRPTRSPRLVIQLCWVCFLQWNW